MFLRINKITELENYINKSFSLYRNEILALHLKQWKEEDISGKSCSQYKAYKYHLAIYYVILIYLELKQGIHTDWIYYNNKYKLDTIKKCLACDNIILEKLLNIFGLPSTICDGGIECMSLEESFIIEPELLEETIEYNTVNIKDILNNLNTCEILIPSLCDISILQGNNILQLTEDQEFLIL